jgi:hypothetical protein
MKRAAFAIFGVPVACALLAWSAARAQTPKATPEPVRQYVIACAVDELPAEVRKANEAGYTVQLVNECMAVDVKIVCVVSGSGGEDDEGR